MQHFSRSKTSGTQSMGLSGLSVSLTINAHSHCDAADTQMVCAQPDAEFMPTQPVKASVPRGGGSATNITASASQGLGGAAPGAESADGGAAGAAGSKRCRRFIPFSDGVRTIS